MHPTPPPKELQAEQDRLYAIFYARLKEPYKKFASEKEEDDYYDFDSVVRDFGSAAYQRYLSKARASTEALRKRGIIIN